MSFRNKLECLSLLSLFSFVQHLWVRQEPTLVKHLSGASLWGRLLALRVNNTRLKRLARSKRSSVLQNSSLTAEKSFITFAPVQLTSSLS
jgi:hypothetical protein